MAQADRMPYAVEATGHGRVDLGAAADFAAVAIPLADAWPATFNVAITPPVTVRVARRDDGAVTVTDDHGPRRPTVGSGYGGADGLALMLLDHYGLRHGADITITSGIPRSSGLGGSSAVAACLCACLSALTQRGFRLDRAGQRDLIALATLAEVASGQSLAGGQDAAACVAGHANLWHWHHERAVWFERGAILPEAAERALEDRLLVAFLEPHVSSEINVEHIAGAGTSAGRQAWRRILAAVHQFAAAVRAQDWPAAVKAMREEHLAHRQLVPRRVTSRAVEMIRAAEALGGAAAVTGGGAGGSLWGIVQPERRSRLTDRWEALLADRRYARVWCPRIAPGLRLKPQMSPPAS